MGLLDSASRYISSLFNRGQVLTTVQTVGNRAIYPDMKADQLIKDGFSGNDAVYTIVSTTSKKFAAVPRGVYKDDQSGLKKYKAGLRRGDVLKVKHAIKSIGEQILDGDYERLMKRPNPYMGQDSFFEAIYLNKEVLGEAFIWINRGDTPAEGDARYKVKPLELYVLPPQHVELIADEADVMGVSGYVLNNSGSRVPLKKEDVIHWRTYNPNYDPVTREHIRGLSPLKAGEKLLTANDSSKDAMVAMFQNDGAKGVIFNETFDSLTPQQRDQVQSVINKKVNNRDVKGAVATLQGKWGYIDLGKSSVDMDLLNAQDMSFSRLCNLFRVSPNLFLAGQTRDNLREARKDLITNKIMPDALSLDDELNRVLSKSFQGQVFMSDFSTLPEMQYELSDMNGILKDMYDRGIINGAEYREQMGWDQSGLPEHEQFFVSGNVVPIGEAAMPSLTPLDGLDGGNQ